MKSRLLARFAGMAALLVLLACTQLFAKGCYTVTEPPCPGIIIPGGDSSECSQFCTCKKEQIVGKAFRMTRIEVDEPEQFAGLLNNLWAADVRNNILNVLFVVADAKPGTSSAFNQVTFLAGPGWRDPKDPLSLPPPVDQPSDSVVDSYCLLEGTPVEVKVKPYHGNQCTFKSETASSLLFHSGPLDNPVVCAPKVQPANEIPLNALKVRFNFNGDCTAINNGYMEGCILTTDADKICMCIVTGTCPIKPTHRPYDPTDLSAYCTNECGESWASFGEIVKAFGMPPSCLMPDGSAGYRIQGFFDATVIENKYNPVQSGDCMKH